MTEKIYASVTISGFPHLNVSAGPYLSRDGLILELEPAESKRVAGHLFVDTPCGEACAECGRKWLDVLDRREEWRVGVRLSPQAKLAVEEIMRIGQIATMQEAIRRAISDELFLMKERSEGWKVKLEKGNQEREVRWPDHLF